MGEEKGVPLTISQAFTQLRSNLEITDLQETTVSTRQTRVRAALDRGLETIESFLTGSYRRKTMIAPLNDADVDIFCVLAAKHFDRDRPAAVLDGVRAVLLETYTSSPAISRNGQAVTIRFTDFKVDVVPAFNRSGGGFLIPNTVTGAWISTDPRVHVRRVSEENAVHSGQLVPMFKILKSWNRLHGSFFPSFHIEVLGLSIFENISISDDPSGVRFFFSKAVTLVREKNPDPAGFDGDVGGYINTEEKLRQAVAKLNTAYEISAAAEALGTRGQTAAAFAKWKELFGDYFPAYR